MTTLVGQRELRLPKKKSRKSPSRKDEDVSRSKGTSSSKKEKSKKSKSKKKKSRKRDRDKGKSGEENPSKKQKKVETEEDKKEKREKMKGLPKLKRRHRNTEAMAMQELRTLTKVKARALASKPVFLSKAKRKVQKDKEAKEKAKSEKRRLEQIRKLRHEFRKQNESGRYREEEYRRKRREEEKEKRREESKTRVGEAREQEYELIKQAYLGKKKKKKLLIPPSQKFKFNFDWDAGEDTSEQYNNLYKKKHDIAPKGRGTMAGYDQEEQMKKINSNITRLNNRTGRTPIFNQIEGGLAEVLAKKREERKQRNKLKEAKKKRDHRHWTKKKLEEMTARDWRIFNEDFRITTKFGGKLPAPIRFWGETDLPDELMDAIKEAQYKKPYPIQRVAIPVGLSNRDCVGIAETGSGKTAAFVIPMLVYITKQPKMTREIAGDGPYALILAPARELAAQIDKEVKKFARHLNFKSMVIVGGVDIHMQSALAAHGVEVIIATPGRLLDSLKKRFLALNQCKYIVMDEADRMIDMGFSPDVEAIMDRMPVGNMRPLDMSKEEASRTYRQTFMFTATMPTDVQRIAKKYLRNPVFIQIGDPNETAAKNVKQIVLWTTDSAKRKKLTELLDNRSIEPPIMIFMNMKKACETLVRFLRDQDYNAEALHGGRIQEHRQAALRRFRERQVDILVCTDVAGRGIDVKGVKAVVNYDMSSTVDAYCHRIGRTGRAGETGEAFTFLTEHDVEVFYDLRQLLLNGQFHVPRELDRHPCARIKGRDPKKKSGPKIIYAK